MKKPLPINTLFLDIGGVLLDNGWDHLSRRRAVRHFGLNGMEMEHRHRQYVSLLEEDGITLDEYLKWVVFYEKRPFTRAEFRRFMFAQSKPFIDMIDLIRRLKRKYGLRIIVLSNESRELNAYRIRTFRLHEFVDAFISSCFVGLRKPDPAIFRMALDLAQTAAPEIVNIDDTRMFIQIAEVFGIRGIHHVDCKSTCARLASFGLLNEEEAIHEAK